MKAFVLVLALHLVLVLRKHLPCFFFELVAQPFHFLDGDGVEWEKGVAKRRISCFLNFPNDLVSPRLRDSETPLSLGIDLLRGIVA